MQRSTGLERMSHN